MSVLALWSLPGPSLTLSLTFLTFLMLSTAAPIKNKLSSASESSRSASGGRQHKSLGFFDYIQPEEVQFTANGATYDTSNTYDNTDSSEDDYDYEGNELSSRTLPKRKRLRPKPAASPAFNSPIYYIRLPPQPYMFVPGLGYVSQPAPSPVQQFLNLPVSFVSNGKPASIYQWSSGLQSAFTGSGDDLSLPPPPPSHHRPMRPPIKQPAKPTDSTIHRLPGQFPFNGKPEDIFVLRDSYNSLYSDALQNFYP